MKMKQPISVPVRLGDICRGLGLRGSIIADISTCFRYFRSLSVDPFADIRRAVSEYSSIAFCLSKEFHSLPIHQIDAFEIQDNPPHFALNYVSECVQILFSNPTAHTQDYDVVAVDNPIDSATHFETADAAFGLMPTGPLTQMVHASGVSLHGFGHT
jgi:hypothetical protein